MREVNTHKIIRIFLASSIDDTKEERDKLQNKILAVWNPIFNKFNIACNCSCMTAAFQTMVTPLFIGVSYSENWIPFLRMTVSAIFSIMPSCTLYR